MSPAERQRHAALSRSHELRRLRGDIRRALKLGELTVSQALHDQATRGMRVIDLLLGQHYWGPKKAKDALREARVPVDQVEVVRVGQLSLTQRLLLLAACGETA